MAAYQKGDAIRFLDLGYTQLKGELKSLLDIYEKESYRHGLKTGTVRASISASSGSVLKNF